MTDALLLLHVLGAFLLVSTVVMLSGVALGTPAPARTLSLANLFWDVGGIATLVFGVWLTFRDDVGDYGLLDAWIIAALVLWAIGTELGRRARLAVTEEPARFAQLHWLRAAVIVLLLADMIFKPGA